MESDATDLTHKLRLWKAHKEELELFKSRKLATKPKWGAAVKPTPEKTAPFTPSANRLNRQSTAELTPQKSTLPLKTPSVTPSRISVLHPQSFYSLQLEAAQSFLQAGEYAKSAAVFQLLWASPYSEQASHDTTFWDGWFRATNGGSSEIPQPATPARKPESRTPLRTPSETVKSTPSARPHFPSSRQATSQLPTVAEANSQTSTQSTGSVTASKVSFFSPRKNVTTAKYRLPSLGTPRTLAAKRVEFLGQQPTTPAILRKKSFGSLTPVADRLRKGLQQIDEDDDKRREAALNAIQIQPMTQVFEEQALSEPLKSVVTTNETLFASSSSPGTPKAMKMLKFGVNDEKSFPPPSEQVEKSSTAIPTQNINELAQQTSTASPGTPMPKLEPKYPEQTFAQSTSSSSSPLNNLQQLHDATADISPIACARPPLSTGQTFHDTTSDKNDITTRFPHSSLDEKHCDEHDHVEKELSETLDHLAKLNSSSSSSPSLSSALSTALVISPATSFAISPPVVKLEKKPTKRKSSPPSTPLTPPAVTTPTDNFATPAINFILPPSVSTRKEIPIIHTLLLPTFSEDELAEGTIALEAVRVKNLRKSTQNEIANYDSKADMILSPVRRSARRKSVQTPDEIQALLAKTNNMYSPNPDLQPTSTAKRLRPAAPRFPLASVKEEAEEVGGAPFSTPVVRMEESPLPQSTDSLRRSARTSAKMPTPFVKRSTPRRVDTPRPLKLQPRTSAPKSTRSRGSAQL